MGFRVSDSYYKLRYSPELRSFGAFGKALSKRWGQLETPKTLEFGPWVRDLREL